MTRWSGKENVPRGKFHGPDTVSSEHGVEGEVQEFRFEDFSQARNQALEKARASSGEFDSSNRKLFT